MSISDAVLCGAMSLALMFVGIFVWASLLLPLLALREGNQWWSYPTACASVVVWTVFMGFGTFLSMVRILPLVIA